MPWSTPTLKTVRSLVRDAIRGNLPGADATVPNSVLRVMSDSMGGLCHMTLQYVDWLALQLIPDTAETEWLDRHGDIWLVNSDGTTGRKLATLAEGIILVTGDQGAAVPIGTQFAWASTMTYESTELVILSDVATPVPVRAIDPGAAGNRDLGDTMTMATPAAGVVAIAEVLYIGGGADTENDDDLRTRVLERIRQPPMGGAAHDYVRWAKAVPGVTRAWCVPNEMGIGTVTVRIMCDVLRADNDGFPFDEDLARVTAYIDTVRPVTTKDFWVLGPIKQFIDVHIDNLVPDNTGTRAGIEENLQIMLFDNAAPGQTIYAVWKSSAILLAPSVVSFDLVDWDDDVMESSGHMAVLGDIIYGV